MKKTISQSPLLIKYETLYGKNPRSRVFAPLAETYRKLDMLDRAIEVLKKGLRHHPSYLLGHLGLAHCFFDRDEFQKTYDILLPFVKKNCDNLRLQKLFAMACRKIGDLENALISYKYLLFLNPKDHESAAFVKAIEDEGICNAVEREGAEVAEKSKKAQLSKETNIDDWSSFNTFQKVTEGPYEANGKHSEIGPLKYEKVSMTSDSDWAMNVDLSQRDAHFEEVKKLERVRPKQEKIPVMTHTLVDLYLEQGYVSKAREILEKLLELNPRSQSTIKKLEDVTARYNEEEVQMAGNEEGENAELLNLFDQQTREKNSFKRHQSIIEKKLLFFVQGLKGRAQSVLKRAT